jgi:hypothetical protein
VGWYVDPNEGDQAMWGMNHILIGAAGGEYIITSFLLLGGN